MKNLAARSTSIIFALFSPLIGGVAPLTFSFSLQAPASAQQSSVAELARSVTVRIEGATQGSGVLIAKEGNKYTVLTAWHVVGQNRPGEEVRIITNDGVSHMTNVSSFRRISSTDLASITFLSDRDYLIVRKGPMNRLQFNEPILVSGFPLSNSPLLKISPGYIRGDFEIDEPNGYQTYYNAKTLAGMSGGPVINESGFLVAIHGKGQRNDSSTSRHGGLAKTGINKGIPLSLFRSIDEGVPMPLSNKESDPMYYIFQAILGLEMDGRSLAINPFNTALDLSRKGLSLSKKEPDIQKRNIYLFNGYYAEGGALLGLGKFKEASEAYARAIQIYEKNSSWNEDAVDIQNVYGGLGLAYKKMGDFESAKKLYQKALEEDPSSPFLLTNLANTLIQIGDISSVHELYTKAYLHEMSKEKKDPFLQSLILTNLGLHYEKYPRLGDSIEFYDEAIQIYPLPQAYASRGVALSRRGKKQDALLDLKKAVELDPTQWKAWNDLGIVQEHLKMYEQARVSHQVVIDSHADLAAKSRSFYLIANTYGLEGNWKKSIATREASLRLYPDDRAQIQALKNDRQSLIVSRVCDTRLLSDDSNLSTYTNLASQFEPLTQVNGNSYTDKKIIQLSSSMLKLCPSMSEQLKLRYWRGVAVFRTMDKDSSLAILNRASTDFAFVARNSEVKTTKALSHFMAGGVGLHKASFFSTPISQFCSNYKLGRGLSGGKLSRTARPFDQLYGEFYSAICGS